MSISNSFSQFHNYLFINGPVFIDEKTEHGDVLETKLDLMFNARQFFKSGTNSSLTAENLATMVSVATHSTHIRPIVW